jgi:hypothetical protein
MGSCFSCCSVVTIHVVLKLPHGHKGLLYHNGAFVPMESVQDWVQSLYSSGWTGWTAYNDDTTVTNKKTKGHCKGVVTWNASKIGWLIHSVPHFPYRNHYFFYFTHSSIRTYLWSILCLRRNAVFERTVGNYFETN